MYNLRGYGQGSANLEGNTYMRNFVNIWKENGTSRSADDTTWVLGAYHADIFPNVTAGDDIDIVFDSITQTTIAVEGQRFELSEPNFPSVGLFERKPGGCMLEPLWAHESRQPKSLKNVVSDDIRVQDSGVEDSEDAGKAKQPLTLHVSGNLPRDELQQVRPGEALPFVSALQQASAEGILCKHQQRAALQSLGENAPEAGFSHHERSCSCLYPLHKKEGKHSRIRALSFGFAPTPKRKTASEDGDYCPEDPTGSQSSSANAGVSSLDQQDQTDGCSTPASSTRDESPPSVRAAREREIVLCRDRFSRLERSPSVARSLF